MNKEEKLKQRIGYLVAQYENVIADFELRIDDLTRQLAESTAKITQMQAEQAPQSDPS